MSERHEFYYENPKYLDMGELVDAETGELIRPATAQEALKTIKARRRNPPPNGGVFCMDWDGETIAVTVQKREGWSNAEWRLAIALKLRFDRAMTRGDYD